MFKLFNANCRSIHRRFIALGVALLLLSAQHAAFAHHLTHFSFGGEQTQIQQVAQQDTDSAHMVAELQSHICSTCIALDSLDVALPVIVAAVQGDAVAFALSPVSFSQTARLSIARYQARAPPVLL